jgi:hypothetical protein
VVGIGAIRMTGVYHLLSFRNGLVIFYIHGDVYKGYKGAVPIGFSFAVGSWCGYVRLCIEHNSNIKIQLHLIFRTCFFGFFTSLYTYRRKCLWRNGSYFAFIGFPLQLPVLFSLRPNGRVALSRVPILIFETSSFGPNQVATFFFRFRDVYLFSHYYS